MIKCKTCNLWLLVICSAIKKGNSQYWQTGLERAGWDYYSQEWRLLLCKISVPRKNANWGAFLILSSLESQRNKSKTIQVSLIQQGLQNPHSIMKMIYKVFLCVPFLLFVVIILKVLLSSYLCMADEDAIHFWRSQSFFSSGMWNSLGHPTGAQGGQTASDYLQQTELLTPPLPSVFFIHFE